MKALNSFMSTLILKITTTTLTCQIIVQQILLFFGKKTTLLGPTRLLISENFPSKPDFHIQK